MKILLFGKNGQLGSALQTRLANFSEVIALNRNSNICGDLTNLEAIEKTIYTIKPDIIINAAAFTAVDAAETNQELAYLVNSKAPETMARASREVGALCIHYSTDYVFNGSGNLPWKEDDATDPLNYYGKTKLWGEEAIKASGCKFLIFRTSWVYSNSGNNFVKTIIKLAQTKETIKIVDDQIGAPTSAEFIAKTTTDIIKNKLSDANLGIYHLTSAGTTSWFGFANFILAHAKNQGIKLQVKEILPIKSKEYVTPAIRPLNSRLNCSKLENTFGVSRSDWKTLDCFGLLRQPRNDET